MKESELKVLAALFKNARISDRELAKQVGISQPTVSRTRLKLQKEGIIREYTVIPDFVKLGYELAAITFVKMKEIPSTEVHEAIEKQAKEMEEKNPSPVIASMKGIGLNADYMSVSFHKDYSEYSRYMEFMRHFPHVKPNEISSFLIDLTHREHFRFLILSVFADYLLRTKETA